MHSFTYIKEVKKKGIYNQNSLRDITSQREFFISSTKKWLRNYDLTNSIHSDVAKIGTAAQVYNH